MKKRKCREDRRTTFMKERNRRKYPSILKENKLKTCTEKLIKASPLRKRSQTVKIKKMGRSEQAKRRLHQFKKTGKSVFPGHNSEQLSTIFYKGLVDSLRSMVSHKSSVGSTSNHTPTIESDNIDKQSVSDCDKTSFGNSIVEGQAPPTKRVNFSRKQLASERMEAEKKRLEQTVLRSVETRFKEMMMEVPKDKDFRITNKLGGYLARHAWKRFYTGKSSPCERVNFLQNSRNKYPPWGRYKLYRPLVHNRKIKYYLVVHGFDLTPRKFKSNRYPYCPVTYDALWFFSNILKDSKIRRNRIKYKYEFLRKESAVSQNSGSHRFTLDEKSLFDGSVIPHLVFREEDVNSQETEEDDVPPMFTLRRDLKSLEPEDRQALQFRVFLTETETIELISIESRHNYSFIEKETSVVFSESYKPEKKLSKVELLKKRKKRNVFIDGMNPKIKEEKDMSTLRDASFIIKSEKSVTEFEPKTFETRGVQVVTKTRRSSKVQVNAPTRKNASTLVTTFDFTAEANKEKTFDVIKWYNSKTSETEGSTSSDDFEVERSDDPLIVTKSSDFRETLMYVQRIISSNIYKKPQMFYARYHVDPLSGKLPISYECVHLWTFHDYRIQLSQMIVSSIAPHPFDSNIIAVAYAKNELATRDFGLVCIWNIKNIFFPEQVIKFSSSINYIEFSHPTTISVALMGGFVAVINISKKKHKITMNTERTTTAGFLPIWQFSWFLEENGEKFPVSCGADGRMLRYRTDETFAATVLFEATPIENKLRGVKGSNGEFKTTKWKERPEMTACAQHPTDRQSYLVGTSEGTVHICSLLLRNNLELFSAQEGRINAIKFHPHCEHVFLTVGGDFFVRIWAIGIFEPLLTYSARNEYIEDACFNEIWPELMISISGEFVDIWNIRRRVCVPVQSWSNPKQLKNTCISFSTDGYSVIVGDTGGYVHSFRLCEMPCESKMKAEVLSQAIMSTLSERHDLIAALSKLGYPFSVTYIENFLKATSSRKSDVL
ncbi:WD repeat-containing protein 78-like [Cimex lectularius]|uniref:Dynein axonemal intermediate chain 4 n=1 Tax=Cimex lectularius TaxID=79782 RepID=A0A8I6R5Q7_CIMLE|nr:WD repeat-containing protein 78-like [Cimex lectularius]